MNTKRRYLKKVLACSFLVTFAAAAGCAVDVEDDSAPTPTTEEARGRTGKADLPGTCEVNQCDGKGNGLCWCDAKCLEYGDCCANAIDVCELDGASDCANDNDCADGFCGFEDDNTTRVCKPWAQVGETCGGFVVPAHISKCDPGLKCELVETTGDVPGTCKPKTTTCDPTLICGQAITCVGGQWYSTTCGPANCSEPMGPCGPTVNPPPPAATCSNKCGGPAEAKAFSISPATSASSPEKARRTSRSGRHDTTSMSRAHAGIGRSRNQRTASAYGFPTERGDAARAATRNHG